MLTRDEQLKIQTYPQAARSIEVNLKEYCEPSLPYPAMIAEAARRARVEIDRLMAELAYKNAQLLCLKCNQRKHAGASPGGDQLKLYG